MSVLCSLNLYYVITSKETSKPYEFTSRTVQHNIYGTSLQQKQKNNTKRSTTISLEHEQWGQYNQ